MMDTLKLRQKLLDLAIRGKLVPQDPNDEPASVLLERIHAEKVAMVERGEALNAAAMNALYKRLVTDYFGDDMVIDDEIQYEWARIPHFYRPFYVYKYATGYSTAVALSEGILKEGEPAVKRYKEFLSMGGSAYPLDELRHAGVDLATPAPVDAALEKFERILDDAEATLAKL